MCTLLYLPNVKKNRPFPVTPVPWIFPLEDLELDVISFNACISACEKGFRWERALSLLQEIIRKKLRPTEISYLACKICFKIWNFISSACCFDDFFLVSDFLWVFPMYWEKGWLVYRFGIKATMVWLLLVAVLYNGNVLCSCWLTWKRQIGRRFMDLTTWYHRHWE